MSITNKPAIDSAGAKRYAHGDELSRFSSNGKTFFFNRFIAKNDAPYLAINALYGKGRQERMVLFEPHWLQFLRHLMASVEKLTGVEFPEYIAKPAEQEPAEELCPNCGWHLSNRAYNEEHF